jgi:hypothetical protein
MLMEQEKSLFPLTMPLIESNRLLKNIQKEIDGIKSKIMHLHNDLFRKKQQWRRIENETNRAKRELIRDPHQENEEGGGGGGGGGEEKRETVNYLRPCAREDCPGHIQSRTGICATCEGVTCIHCNIPLPLSTVGHEGHEGREGHECREEDKEHWNLIKSSTKPCPGCRTRITKISGCDQMWCPQCHTAFRWSTGVIERGAIHNPEYYRWMFGGQTPAPRNINGAGGEGGEYLLGCGDVDMLPHATTLRNVLQRNVAETGNEREWNEKLQKIHQKISHLQRVEIPNFQDGIGSETGYRTKKFEFRLKYLSKEISAKEFEKNLYRLAKAHRKTQEHNRILETFNILCTEAFHNYIRQPRVITKKNLLDNIQHIQNISNIAIQELNTTYKSHISLLKTF